MMVRGAPPFGIVSEAAMTVRVTCPFCNTAFALADAPPSGRATCPRCLDSFPTRGRIDEVSTDAAPAILSAPLSPTPTRFLRRALAVVVALAVVGSGIGYFFSRSWSKPVPDPELAPSVATTSPADLHGLGYIPPGANVVFAVRPGPILDYAARTNQDVVPLLTSAGVPQSVLVALGRAGVALPQIDHVSGGALVPDADLGRLRLALVLVLRAPLADEPKFLEQLQARRVVRGGRTRYEVEFADAPLRLTKAAPVVWVFGWSDADLEAAETGGMTPLAPGLRESITDKVSADAAVWLATDDARWAEKESVQFLVARAGKKEWLPTMARGRAAVASLTLADAPRLQVCARCADTATAEQLRAFFGKTASAGVRSAGAGEWAMLDAPADSRAVFAPLKKLLDGAGK